MAKRSNIFLGTNTKMYKTIAQTKEFLSELRTLTHDISRDEMTLFVIPSFTALQEARKTVSGSEILLGAQNMGWEDAGPFTGEISPLMLKELGIQIAEIGHSERRHVLGETDEMENKKVLCALRHNLIPLVCIGETKEQKEQTISAEILRIQLKIALKGVSAENANKIWDAYEPVWAIGASGVPADSNYVSKMHGVIRQTLTELFGTDGAHEIPILYGGSVNKQNASELIRVPDVDGLFIGRSAWNAKNFNSIIRDVLPIFRGKKSN